MENSSIRILTRKGERMLPCFTPHVTVQLVDVDEHRFSFILWFAYHSRSRCTIYLETLRSNNFWNGMARDVLSNALDIPKKHAYTWVLRRVYSSVAVLNREMAKSVPWIGLHLHANWLSFVLRLSENRLNKSFDDFGKLWAEDNQTVITLPAWVAVFIFNQRCQYSFK